MMRSVVVLPAFISILCSHSVRGNVQVFLHTHKIFFPDQPSAAYNVHRTYRRVVVSALSGCSNGFLST